MAKKDGGPAFPTTEWGRTQKGELAQQQVGGMSLRDYFAGQAIPVVNENFAPRHNESQSDWASWVAKTAYEVADAMLAARDSTLPAVDRKG